MAFKADPHNGEEGKFGVFATELIQFGEVILCEDALTRPITSDSRRTNHSCAPNAVILERCADGYHMKVLNETNLNFEAFSRCGEILASISKSNHIIAKNCIKSPHHKLGLFLTSSGGAEGDLARGGDLLALFR